MNRGTTPLIEFTAQGMACRRGGFHIDPARGVDRAIITHAHGDHARPGSRAYLAHHDSVPLLKLRLGERVHVTGVAYGEPIRMNDVTVSLHPAGHVVGSAQIRLEAGGEVWVVSGDYKRENDDVSCPFEPLRCHTFVTEATFGLPVYRWPRQEAVYADINAWWSANAGAGTPSVIQCYALGKSQRLLRHLDLPIGPVFAHPAIVQTTRAINACGRTLPLPAVFSDDDNLPPNACLLSPVIPAHCHWATGAASGWMCHGKGRRRNGVDRGFVLSDHADWEGLNQTVRDTQCEAVRVVHGCTRELSRWLRESGLDASPGYERLEEVVEA